MGIKSTDIAMDVIGDGAENGDGQLLSRARLLRRWRHGSDSFFWRAEADGLLSPVRIGRDVRYSWPSVFRFEGGLPPEGLEQAYRADLLTPEEVAVRVDMSRAAIIARARGGVLPAVASVSSTASCRRSWPGGSRDGPETP